MLRSYSQQVSPAELQRMAVILLAAFGIEQPVHYSGILLAVPSGKLKTYHSLFVLKYWQQDEGSW